MTKNLKLTLATLLLTLSSSFAQTDFRDGFIITLEKDSIRGQVDYRPNSKNYESAIFKNETKITEYKPGQILGFGYIKDKKFVSQINDGFFVEVLIEGDISLYKSEDKYHLKKDTTIIDLESIIEEVEINGKTVARQKYNWRGSLTYLISDCLDNANRITDRIKLTDKLLTNLIIRYNECRDSEFIEYKADIPWTQFEFGASIGTTYSSLQTKEKQSQFAYLDESYSSIDPSIGVVMGITMPRITDRVSFQSEIHLFTSHFSSYLESSSTTQIKYSDTYINLSTLSMPFSFKYSFPEKKYNWAMQGGINFDYHLEKDTKLLEERAAGTVVVTLPESKAFEINDSQLGYWGGLEISRSYRRFKGALSLRYFKMLKFNKTEGFEANNNRFSVNLILFKR